MRTETDDPQSDTCPECGRSFDGTGGMMKHFGKAHPTVPKPWQRGARDWKALREFILKRDDRQCQRCGDHPASEVHHLIPRSAGGPDAPENLLTVCEGCHQEIHDDFTALPETHPDIFDALREVAQGATND